MGAVTSLICIRMVGGRFPLLFSLLMFSFPMLSCFKLDIGTAPQFKGVQKRAETTDLDKILDTGDCWTRVMTALDKLAGINFQTRKRSFASFRWRPAEAGLKISEDDTRLRNKAYEMMNLLQKLMKVSPSGKQ